MRRHGRATAIAALLYLVAALACYAPVLRHPFGLLPVNHGLKPMADQLSRWDQSVAVAQVARNAHALLTEPWHFFDGFQCHPMPRSYTLGEHMFGCGVLAAAPYLASGDPIFAYNALLVLSVWIAGLGMYFLARELVRSAPAAFVAGLLFAIAAPRVGGVAHPFAYADQWTPLALLFLLRLFARGGVKNALAFTLFAGLEILQSLYPLIWTTVLLLCVSLYLTVVHRRHLVARLPAMLTSLVLLALLAWLVFAPYLETQATWGLLSDRVSLPIDPRNYFALSPLFVLGGLGLVDRLRGPRRVLGVDLRLCLLVAGVLLLWLAAGPVTLFGVQVSLRRILRSVVPGFDAVRGLYTMVLGTDLVLAVLAAYGVRALLERLHGRTRLALVAVLVAWIAWAQHAPLDPWPAAAAAEEVALLERTHGPVLELPYPAKASLRALTNADLLRFTSYDLRRSSACYASFASPLDDHMRALAERVPDAGTLDALAALGFRTVLLHRDRYFPAQIARLEATLDQGADLAERVRLAGRSERMAFYDLRAARPATHDLARLVPDAGAAAAPLAAAPAARVTLDFAVANGGATPFRLPDPIAPSDVLLRWTTPAGDVAAEEKSRALLPLALAPGASLPVLVDVTAPSAPGDYVATLALATRPEQALGRRAVAIAPARDEPQAPSPGTGARGATP